MKRPRITPELKAAVAQLLAAQAHTAVVRPIVDAYHKTILNTHTYTYAQHAWSTRSGRITDPKDAWLMDEAQTAEYYALLDDAAKAAGFDLPAGNCPLLTAEYEEIKARWALCDAAEPIFHVTRDQIAAANKLTEYTDLLTKLVLAA